MRVTKNMLHPELQSSYWMLKASSKLLMNAAGVKLLNMNSARMRGKNIDTLHCEEKYIPSRSGGDKIRVRIFKPLNHAEKLPAMLYIHGGGYMLGSPEEFMTVIKNFIDTKPCIVVAPDYRKAHQAPYPAAFNDCYDTLLWMNENIGTLNLVSDKLIVGGHSAGGGLAAAVTLKATDTQDVKIAFQMPIYPMLDDRQDSESAIDNNAPNWDSKANKMGWARYLAGTKQVSPYAAPARAQDLSKLPPTITFVGDLEPFRDETLQYVGKLKKAGIPVTFKLFKGCYHAFEILFPQLEVSKAAWAFVLTAFGQHIDSYIYETASHHTTDTIHQVR